jgi:hypothetical protein
MMLVERYTQKAPALGQHVGVALTQVLEYARRALDIGEKQRNGSRREFAHIGTS